MVRGAVIVGFVMLGEFVELNEPLVEASKLMPSRGAGRLVLRAIVETGMSDSSKTARASTEG